MNLSYEELMKHYTKELQILDLIDWLKGTTNSLEIPDYLEADPSNERTDVGLHQKDQIQEAFSLDN